MYNASINKLTSSSIFEKSEHEVFHAFTIRGDKVSKTESKQVLTGRFLGLVKVLVSIDLLLAVKTLYLTHRYQTIHSYIKND